MIEIRRPNTSGGSEWTLVSPRQNSKKKNVEEYERVYTCALPTNKRLRRCVSVKALPFCVDYVGSISSECFVFLLLFFHPSFQMT